MLSRIEVTVGAESVVANVVPADVVLPIDVKSKRGRYTVVETRFQVVFKTAFGGDSGQ